MAYRSTHSNDSDASLQSYPPVSFDLCISGCSTRTNEDGPEQLAQWVQQFEVFHPYSEVIDVEAVDVDMTSSADPDTLTGEAGYSEVKANSCPGRIVHQSCQGSQELNDQTSQVTIVDDAEELRQRTEQYVCLHPVENVPAEPEATSTTMTGPLALLTTASSAAEHAPSAFADVSATVVPPEHTQCLMQVQHPVPVFVAMPVAVYVAVPQAPANSPFIANAPCNPTIQIAPRSKFSNSSQVGSKVRLSHLARNMTQQQAHRSSHAPAREQGATPQKELPLANEKTWGKRIKKRFDGLDHLRDSDIYRMHQDISGSQRPSSPNPYDRNLSKRDWELLIAECRKGWRHIHSVRQRQV